MLPAPVRSPIPADGRLTSQQATNRLQRREYVLSRAPAPPPAGPQCLRPDGRNARLWTTVGRPQARTLQVHAKYFRCLMRVNLNCSVAATLALRRSSPSLAKSAMGAALRLVVLHVRTAGLWP